MSKIGKKPIEIPAGVEISMKEGIINVKGPKGTLTFKPNTQIQVKIEGKEIKVERSDDEPLKRSLHGLTRTLISNISSFTH